MKPLLSEANDDDALRLLGRASVQVVHDLKNQLNGLKLYATFLKKRLEKGERPADELETVTKLITGLDRMAKDVSLITQFPPLGWVGALDSSRAIVSRHSPRAAPSNWRQDLNRASASPPG